MPFSAEFRAMTEDESERAEADHLQYIKYVREKYGIDDNDPQAADKTGKALGVEIEAWGKAHPEHRRSDEEVEAFARALGCILMDTTKPAVDGMYPIVLMQPEGRMY